ncbi:MAG: acyl-CoA dehydrogenase family protein [Sphingobacterium sp.]|uniref:acyl-CoA dehydrogenase family protein n=1 Tax=Sphingobacterium sp. JB170 TaxID=1434842 RepID=UPI00097EB596|nr:acyl-CoA dehydrogenase family protein [Sphingobacterium sp. JB170]SJN45704.1 Butyryl-CoA dehydrogenase [Sphingobacterium sp. JB170]
MSEVIEQLDFNSYIAGFRKHLYHIFREKYDYNKISLNRDFPADFLKEIMDHKPLAVSIPTIHGGRGVSVKECLGVLSAASYESLALSLTFGINIALFLEPLAKYGDFDVQHRVFREFIENNAMGGLMITEKAYGSDALNMKTSYQPVDGGYKIKGEKHWQGLSGVANFWLVTARKSNANGDLIRDIDFFVTDDSNPSQHISVLERYNNLGLYAIPYGVNTIDVVVPEEQKLTPESTGIKLMLDMLHRSRLQFPGMGLGFIKRLLDESMEHCQKRMVGGVSLNNNDSVKFQLARIQAAYTICSGMCSFSVGNSGVEHDLATLSIEANSVKALVTDLMHESAQISLQLSGANGYRLDHIAGRSVIDSRPFQVFEGSNEMLYAQIAEGVLKLMRKSKESNLLAFLKAYKRTNLSASYFRTQIDFQLDGPLSQRDAVTLGRMIARVICFQFVLEMNGYNEQLVEITRQHIVMDLIMYNGQLNAGNNANPTFDYQENSDWMDFV